MFADSVKTPYQAKPIVTKYNLDNTAHAVLYSKYLHWLQVQ